jgi:hypothetical protein
MPLVHITSSRRDPAAKDVLFAVDSPTTGASLDFLSIPIMGWAFAGANAQDIVALEVRSGGRLLSRSAPALVRHDVGKVYPQAQRNPKVGFTIVINALEVGREFSLDLLALLHDRESRRLATIEGRRESVRPDRQFRYQPLIMSCLGRVGSTWLALLLDQHPGLISYRPFEFEIRHAVYWMEILRSLSRPSSYLQPLAADLSDPKWWMGDKLPGAVTVLPEPSVLSWMGGRAIKDLAAFCCDRIESFYACVGTERKKEDAAFFVEKNGNPFVGRMLAELYPDGREIFLVRDFRDMYASMVSYNHQLGFAFGKQAATEDEHLQHVRQQVQDLAVQWRERKDRSFILHYEDVVRTPESALAGLFDFLGLDAGKTTMSRMVKVATATLPDFQKSHRTSKSPADSIGRWKKDLPPELAKACDRTFADILPEFGY